MSSIVLSLSLSHPKGDFPYMMFPVCFQTSQVSSLSLNTQHKKLTNIINSNKPNRSTLKKSFNVINLKKRIHIRRKIADDSIQSSKNKLQGKVAIITGNALAVLA
ncbi:hypothetical protein TorRG33x02_340510, partial [Trema orientale]